MARNQSPNGPICLQLRTTIDQSPVRSSEFMSLTDPHHCSTENMA